MFHCRILFQLILLLNGINGVEQRCKFFNRDCWYKNSQFYGALKKYHECYLYGIDIFNENETVTTNTEGNPKSNEDIEVVYYNSGNLKFIPNSLFTTFPNLRRLSAAFTNTEVIKPQQLKNASKLKVFIVHMNDVTKLTSDLFVEAPNLEHINFSENKITSVHRYAFRGLSKLQGVYLEKNMISNIHPETFSHLVNLNILILVDNACINDEYNENANQQFKDIENDIRKSCDYIAPDKM